MDVPAGLYKSLGQVESQAGSVVDFAVAGEFGAADALSPVFAGGQKRPRDAASAVCVIHIDALQEADGTGFAAFHIIVAELALGKTDGIFTIKSKEAGSFGLGS